VNSLPKTVTLQRRDCDLNPSEYSTLTYTTLVFKKGEGSAGFRS